MKYLKSGWNKFWFKARNWDITKEGKVYWTPGCDLSHYLRKLPPALSGEEAERAIGMYMDLHKDQGQMQRFSFYSWLGVVYPPRPSWDRFTGKFVMEFKHASCIVGFPNKHQAVSWKAGLEKTTGCRVFLFEQSK